MCQWILLNTIEQETRAKFIEFIYYLGKAWPFHSILKKNNFMTTKQVIHTIWKFQMQHWFKMSYY